MATVQKHLQQARHNESLLQKLSSTEFPDWYGTIAFYSAIHYVEALFRHFGASSHDHRQREYLLKESYPAIFKQYRPLLNWSMTARYDCSKMKHEGVKADLVDARLPRLKQLIEDQGLKIA